MATLYDLRTSITLLPHSDVLALFKDIRAKRRRVREEKALAFAAKAEAKKVRKKQDSVAKIATSLNNMSEEGLEAMLAMMQNLMTQIGETNSGPSDNQVPSSGSSSESD